MSFATYAVIKAAVQKQLDLEDETFITDAELMNYCNQAVHEAESIIHSIYEDYFLDSEGITLANGTSEYSLPSDIYALKIRALIYDNGSTKYPVKRMRSKAFEQIPHVQAGDEYTYLITNDATSGLKLKLYPTPAESGAYLTLWYLRNAATIDADADVVDIVEFRAFIEKYMIMKCLQKEGHPGLVAAAADFEAEKKLMIESLTNRVPDNDDQVEMDLSFYREHN